MEFEAEEIILSWCAAFIGMCDELVPDIERIFFMLLDLLSAKIGNRGAEVLLFLFDVLVGRARNGIICNEPVCSVTYKRFCPFGSSTEKAEEVLFLLIGKFP